MYLHFPRRNHIKYSRKKCCRCYNYEHACHCYKQTHPMGCNKCVTNDCFCHDYPGHFGSVCHANPCDPGNNCCKKSSNCCKSYKDNHQYNCCEKKGHHDGYCCPREKASPYDVRSCCGPGLISYNTYTYYHHKQEKDDFDIINGIKHFRHRCKSKCNCIIHCCTVCKCYYHCKPNDKRECPGCHHVDPCECHKCKKKYVPCKQWNYECPKCYKFKKHCFPAPPNYKYWYYN